MKIPASKVPAQVWADRARRRADLDEVESMLLSSWDDSKQVYRIGKELWDELRIDEADEVPVDADAPSDALPAPTDKEGRTDDGMVYIKCPAQVADRVRGYIDALMEGADRAV